MPAYKPTTDI